MTLDGGMVNRAELFDEADLDVALARFDELHPKTPRLENAASRMYDRSNAYLAACEWDAIAELLAHDISTDDRRRVVGSGIRRGRDAQIANLRAIGGVGVRKLESVVIATRGERLALCRTRGSGGGQLPEAFSVEMLNVVEINADNRITAAIQFDPDDVNAAIAELDARYVAGEAAPYARTWSVIAGEPARFSRHELPAATPDPVYVDRRKLVSIEGVDLAASVRAVWDITSGSSIHIEVVHRLSELGAVFTYVLKMTSHEGFDAEVSMIMVFTVEGDLISRVEVFDEEDLDAALARFVELHPQGPRLENMATRANLRFFGYFTIGDWVAIAQIFAGEILYDDRRPVVSGGSWQGRDLVIDNMRAISDFTAENLGFIATRGKRLSLSRMRWSNSDPAPDSFHTEVLVLIEVDADELIARITVFDPEDIDSAFEELDARYLAGEAAAHARTWSVISRLYAGFNRHNLPATTPDWTYVDHRSVISVEASDLPEFISVGWELTPEISIHMETVHRLSDLGAVVTHTARGMSSENFEVEWRMIDIFTVDGDCISGCEMFDEADLDAALARFDQMHPQSPRLENAASQVAERYWSYFAARDWDNMAELLADDISTDDRRRVVSAGSQRGRDFDIASMRALADIGVTNAALSVIATRGGRLALSRIRLSGRDQRPDAFHSEALGIAEIDADGRLVAHVAFDPEDVRSAFAELDARYLAGEAASHSQTWSALTRAYALINRHELPSTTPDWVNIDHRRGRAFVAGDMSRNIRAAWQLAPNTSFYFEAVHRLSNLGVVVTSATHGTSFEGFDAEWRQIDVLMFADDRISRCELFDESDLDAALARFDELHPQATQLDNAASRAERRFFAYWGARNWAAMAEMLAEDSFIDDTRRNAANVGFWDGRDVVIANMQALADAAAPEITTLTVIATRGDRLVLTHRRSPNHDPHEGEFVSEGLIIAEIDADDRIKAHIQFDVDDVDAAFAELDARYLAGEAAAYADTWSRVTSLYATVNRHELPAMTTDSVVIDHRSLISIETVDMAAFFGAVWELTRQVSMRVEAAHRLNSLGAVVTLVVRGTSEEGSEVEWRLVAIVIFEGDRLSRSEVFDEADLGGALARFEELQPQSPRLENAAIHMSERVVAHFAAAKWDALAEILADDFIQDDRRRVLGAGVRRGREAQIADVRAIAGLFGANLTSTPMATRGERLALTRLNLSNRDQRADAYLTEMLAIGEINADGLLVAYVSFDPEDFEAAFEELDARYLAGEAAAYAQTWSVVTQAYSMLNRRELPPVRTDWVNIDHRALVSIEGVDLAASLRALWDITSASSFYVEAVHRLDELGAVATTVVKAVTPEGLDAEVRMIAMGIVKGQLFSRVEYFDEADLDAALERFEELHHQVPRLENVASRVWENFQASNDRTHRLAMTAERIVTDDRRPVVGAGVQRGREVNAADMRAFLDIGMGNMTSTVIATRGERLILDRFRLSGRDQAPEPFYIELLRVLEIDADNRIAACIAFALDDIDAAFEELDTRYLAGEAAAHSHIWSVMTQVQVAYNRHEFPPTTEDWINLDHRLGRAFAPGEMIPYMHATYDVVPNIKGHIEAVHRLSHVGVVITEVVTGTSEEGFDFEWREVALFAFDGDTVCRFEMFDETDLDAALARFDELEPPARRLENAAVRVYKHFFAHYAKRDWAALAAIMTENSRLEDRRRAVNAGLWSGRDVFIENFRATDDFALEDLGVVATRGQRLFLGRYRWSPNDPAAEMFYTEAFCIVEICTDERIQAFITFELDDADAAFAELDSRYIAGEAAVHAQTWSAIAKSYAAVNRREMPPTTPDWVNIDHRRGIAFAPGETLPYLRATWDVAPFQIYIESVHRLTALGAVVSWAAHGTSEEGFDAEWRGLNILTTEADLVNRLEVFDEADLETALARFEELHRHAPRPENAASRLEQRFSTYFAARDWDALTELLSDNISVDDRRPVVNVGTRHGRDAEIANMRAVVAVGVTNMTPTVIATRGTRLVLGRYSIVDNWSGSTALCVSEINAENQIAARVVLGPDDIDAAFEELESRYLAGEAAAQAHTWSVIARTYSMVNRHEVPAMDFVTLDHRRGTPYGPGDLTAAMRLSGDLTPDLNIYNETVHRLSEFGAVITNTAHGTSKEGFAAEWRTIQLVTVEGDRINRLEIFDESDLDAALARFEELDRP
ncbi:nuclear transport factor 2 family protein [Mycobacterium sp. 1245111.1]|uniref:nuclear transport factor 2 family protein n=1 Tax=Mycobacterium sp. 1245111.1 TaxID=1834073 RepID=UPI0012EB0507|nr:hypothetical protein [Mycobacterium sp. 1245111.1]